MILQFSSIDRSFFSFTFLHCRNDSSHASSDNSSTVPTNIRHSHDDSLHAGHGNESAARKSGKENDHREDLCKKFSCLQSSSYMIS